ncbi:hypothetical protein I4U23_005208 [Adineta vaga]|nr:hypothetical protein I4U23_005208 [Adineta vaga]
MNGQFLHCELLLDSLLTMSSSHTEKNSAITYLRKEYKNNVSDLLTIDDFASNYSADQAIRWYTQESFLYRMLNKAFRMQNIDVLYTMRFFIQDICKQLFTLQTNETIPASRVYRGQLIAREELKKFSTGQLVSMNSFLSTTLDRLYASFLLPTERVQEGLAAVLFQIDTSQRLPNAKPFADVTTKSAFPSESEVLFMAGSIFRITDIHLKDDDISLVELVLCSNDDSELKVLFEHMRKDIPSACIPLSYGIVLANAGKQEQAECYFRNVLQELPADHPLIVHCYHQLGNVLDDRGKYEESLEYFEKALTKKRETLPPNDPSVANTLTCCGVGYLRKRDFERAVDFYEQAMNIYKNLYGEEDKNVAMCLFNIGDVRTMNEQHEDALHKYQQALSIWAKCLPELHPDLARAHAGVAGAHLELHQLDLALEHQTTALEIMVKSLPPDHHELAWAHEHMGSIYRAMGSNEYAERHFNEALRINHKYYPFDHENMGDSYMGLGLIYKQRGDYREAVSYLEKALAVLSNTLGADHEDTLKLEKDLDELKAALT